MSPQPLLEMHAHLLIYRGIIFLLVVSDNTSRASNIPLVTPSSLLLSARGRVTLIQNNATAGLDIPFHLTGYLAPEYRPNKYRTDVETEKVSAYHLFCLKL